MQVAEGLCNYYKRVKIYIEHSFCKNHHKRCDGVPKSWTSPLTLPIYLPPISSMKSGNDPAERYVNSAWPGPPTPLPQIQTS